MTNHEQIWQRFRHSATGRIFAAAVIAAPFGAFAAHEVSQSPVLIALAALGAALMGVLAVGILELRDRRRRRSAEWQQNVATTAATVRQNFPLIPPEHAVKAANVIEEKRVEQRLSPIAWIGIVFGGFSLACAVLMLIVRIIEFFRAG